ncbi:MAG: CDP-glucose 4,6-dehydratase [Acidobacteriaceae bacterium]
MAPFADTFWRGRRVFITGHTGFKGVWLSLWLQSLGAEVFGYSTSSPASSQEGKLAVPMQTFRGDICDFSKLHSALDATRPEVVLHMAAQPFVRRAFQDPIGTYRTNAIGTATLLETVRQCDSVRAVLVVTTDKCYENQDWDWAYREIDRLGGSDPYSSSKACMDLVVRSFRDSFFRADRVDGRRVGVASARAGNMLGGGDWGKDRLVPDMIRSFAAGKPVVLRNPQAKRPWQFVLETLRGYLLLAEALYEDPAHYAGAWNFGPGAGDVRSVEWIVEKLAAAWGAEAKWEIQPGQHSQEAPMLRLDCSKAAKELSWTPILDLSDALQMTVDWYRDFYAGKNIAETYADQIAAYSLQANAKWEILSAAAHGA